MRNTDGERRAGRYIKGKNAKLIDNLALYKFSFEEICESPIAHRDNPGSNIIRAKLHEREDIDEVVLEPEGMNKDLRDEESKVPILQPVDFTSEWKRHRARNVGRPVRINDEDELDFDYDEEEALAPAATKKAGPTSETNAANDNAPNGSDKTSDILSEIRSSAGTPEEVQLKNFQAQKKTIDAVGKAIQNINHANTLIDQEDDLALSVLQGQASAAAAPAPIAAPQAAAPAPRQPEFVPMAPVIDQKVVQSHYDAATERGYQDGFKVGEEKATLQLQSSVAPILSNVGSIVAELEHVKKTILDNVQQNFYEITQAIAETLIRREINMSPQAFAAVVRQAISDAVPDDKIVIAVHPTTAESLGRLEIPDLMAKVVKDENVKPGDFRIDSSLSVVDGNISKLIANLIEQADLQLFEKTDKAS